MGIKKRGHGNLKKYTEKRHTSKKKKKEGASRYSVGKKMKYKERK